MFYATRYVELVILIVLGTFCAFAAYQRNLVWESDLTLWKDCVAKSPQKARPHSSLGRALNEHGELQEAIGSYSRALQINPSNNALTHNNFGVALEKDGRH